MKNLVLITAFFNLFSLTGFAQIQISKIDLVKMTLTEQALPQVAGEIKKIDLDQKKLTIKHETIPNLDMPGMTMVFKVDSKIDLTILAVGDKILFTADKINGAYTVLSIKK